MVLSLDFETMMGPFSLLVWISFILYGLSLAQAYIYFRTYSDHLFLKLTVALLCLLQTAQVSANFYFQYEKLILGFSQPIRLLTISWSEIAAPTLELVINDLVQSFYIYRIWQLSKNVHITVYLLVVLWARTAVGFRVFAYAYTCDNFLELLALKPFSVLMVVVLSLSVALDLSITILLQIYLRQIYSSAEIRNTQDIVYWLMYYALSTGVLTAIIATMDLVLFEISDSPVLWGGLLMVLSKVYANSMLAMLNERRYLRSGVVSSTQDLVELSRFAARAVVSSTNTADDATQGMTFADAEDDVWASRNQHSRTRFKSISDLSLQVAK